MLKVEPCESVQWEEGGKHFVGRVMRRSDNPVLVACIDGWTVVKEYHTGRIFAVDGRRLSPYPSSPIPEPGLPIMEAPVS